MVWVRSPVYFYKRNETFYFSRSIPSDLQHRRNKRKIEISAATKRPFNFGDTSSNVGDVLAYTRYLSLRSLIATIF